MKKLLLIVGGLILLLMGAAIALPFLIPVERYKQELTTQVKAATGRDLVIAGPLSLSVFPNLQLKAEDVTFSNAPGRKEPNMLSLDQLSISVKLLPLLSGSLEIDGFELVRPVAHLDVDRNGKGNWEFGDGAEAPAAESGGGGIDDVLKDLKLGDVRLVDGRVTYTDAATGETIEASAINAAVKLPDYSGPLNFKGDLVWKGEKIGLDLSTENLKGLMDGTQQPLKAAISSSPVTLAVDGTATKGDVLKLNGKVSLDVPSVRKLAAWLDTPLDMPGDGLGPLKIDGQLDLNDKNYAFRDATVSLDALKAKGAVAINTAGERIAVNGNLDVEALDLNPYLPPETEETTAWTGWSTDPIDLSGLKAADLDFAFKTQSLKYRKITVGASALTVKLKSGILTADLQDMNLYSGRGKGTVKVDASGTTPAIAMKFDLSGVTAAPLLKDAADFERLSGDLGTSFAITAHGKSQKDMVSTLNGNGTFKFADGTLKGVDLAKVAEIIEQISNGVKAGGADMLTSLTSGNLIGSLQAVASMFGGKGESNAETKFTSLDASWTATNGTISNQDLELIGPLVNKRALFKMNGKGNIALPAETLDYTAEIRSFAKGEAGSGIGGTVKLSGKLTEPDACVVLGSLCIGKNTKPGDLLKQKLKDQLPIGGGNGEKPSLNKLKEGLKGFKLGK